MMMFLSASELGLSFISCPTVLEDGSSGTPFKQYSAHWRDYSVQLLGPIKVYRYFSAANETRVFAGYGKLTDWINVMLFILLFTISHLKVQWMMYVQ